MTIYMPIKYKYNYIQVFGIFMPLDLQRWRQKSYLIEFALDQN